MSIYIPFTYIIGWSQHKKFYYGAKYAKGCQPSDLWETYFTSSNHVKQFREQFGEPDIIKIHKTFADRDACLSFENKYLSKIDAKNNCLFLNENNGWKDFRYDSIQMQQKIKQTCLQRYGYESSNSSPEIQAKKQKTFLSRYGKTNPFYSPEIQTKIQKTILEKYGVDNVSKADSIKEKRKQTCLKKYGQTNNLKNEEIKDKIKQTCLEKYGADNPFKSQEIREKVKQTNFILYGHDNYQKTPEAKKASRERAILQRKNEPMLTCPHCNLVGKGPNMKRYHFDKCKHKKEQKK